MNKYVIEVKEILTKQIVIEAENKNIAINIVKNRFENCEIELTHDDCYESSVICISEEKNNDGPTLFD